MRKLKYFYLLALSCVASLVPSVETNAQACNIYTSSYVTFSPDHQAWTVDQPLSEGQSHGDYPFWYGKEDSFKTGVASSLRRLREGEHYYDYTRTGMIPVGEWKVEYEHAGCIHNLEFYADNYHGINFDRKTCGRPYYSGWVPYCADCGKNVTIALMYMSKEAAQSIQAVDTRLEYYYLCPNVGIDGAICHHLEQGYKEPHECSAISWNRYLVVYEKNMGNDGEEVGGDMANSVHMFNNAEEFEGNPVTPIRTLTLNNYTRIGYRFTGWNTKPDGTGTALADGQEIFNLCSENYDPENLDPEQGKVRLYAQWERVESNLVFDANGGSYSGENPVRRKYNVSYTMDGTKGVVTPPQGHTVSFESNGGSYISPITGTQTFLRWDLLAPLHGRLKGNVYRFLGDMDDTDTARAAYSLDPITLPSLEKPNSSFGGWYLDSGFSTLVGFPGDQYTPQEDATLYAKWVELTLRSTDNYTANSGRGAVDLKWWQPDNVNKTYKLYQSADGGASYAQISSVTESTAGEAGVNQTFGFVKEGDSAKGQTVVIPSSGFYILTADGAQGGPCESYTGGLGGSVSGKFYLTKGEVITFRVGGSDGTNGGGAATNYGNGGGMTEVSSNLKGTLLVSGGGGGASPSGNGQAGGSGTNLVEGNNGGSGMSGGGGGWQGGAAGEYIVHNHVESCNKETTTPAAVRMYAEAYEAGHENTWGNNISYGADWAGLECHSGGGDENENRDYYSMGVGSRSSLIPTPGGGTLGLGIYFENWSDSIGTYGAKRLVVSVMDGTGAEVASYDVLSTPVAEETVEQMPVCNEKPGETMRVVAKTLSGDRFHGTFSHQDGFMHEDDGEAHGTGQITSVTGTLEINIPQDVEGVYIICRTDYFAGGHMETRLSNIRYTHIERNCPYTEGQVLSSKPAYGGGSYINADYAVTQGSDAGAHGGDGAASIQSETIGLAEGQELNGVAAADTMAPYAVDSGSVVKEASFDQVIVAFDPVEDRGTEYYFKAESYSMLTGDLMCVSNITKNLLKTGLAGYLYLVDTGSATSVTLENAANSGSPITERAIAVTPETYVQYLHIAAVDRASNVSETIHVDISRGDTGVAWNLSTDNILIDSEVGGRDYGNVYPAQDDRTYYVRADGATPFLLSYMSYIHGQARIDYQVDYQLFDSRTGSGMGQRYITKLPYSVPVSSKDALDVSKFARQTEGGVILNDAMYTGAARSGQAGTLSFYQAFTIDASFDGETVTVTPVAGASFGASVKYSDWSDDVTHGIRLIADGMPPAITGLEAFQGVEVIDRNEGKITLEIRADDALSGLGDFYLVIENEDNFCKMTYIPDEDGVIRVEVTKDEPIFSGDFTVTAYAVDNVGNTHRETWHVTEFALDTSVERVLSPHEPVFKRGESGDLYISTWGYADRIEVEFPEFLSEYNQTIDYREEPEYRKDETIRFMVPLDAPQKDGASFGITVRAYKGDKELEQHPSISMIKIGGSILDEIRTRLR